MNQDTLDRSKRVLAALIREYIATGEPVASAAGLAAGLGVRQRPCNILARLRRGFVQQPHTLGRPDPDRRGYRFYVDMLLESKRSTRTADAVEGIRREHQPVLRFGTVPGVARRRKPPAGGLRAAAGTRLCGVRPCGIRVAHPNRVLVVIVARGSQLLQKVTEISETLTADDLREASNYLNAEFAGLFCAARQAVLERIDEERSLYDTLFARAMRLATSTFENLEGERLLFVEGTALLLDDGQGVTMSTLQALVQMIEEKQRLVLLLNECIDGPGLTVVIGAEHPSPTLRSFSLIASTYIDAAGTGTTIGVIGPTRMRYSRVIAVVDGARRRSRACYAIPTKQQHMICSSGHSLW